MRIFRIICAHSRYYLRASKITYMHNLTVPVSMLKYVYEMATDALLPRLLWAAIFLWPLGVVILVYTLKLWVWYGWVYFYTLHLVRMYKMRTRSELMCTILIYNVDSLIVSYLLYYCQTEFNLTWVP